MPSGVISAIDGFAVQFSPLNTHAGHGESIRVYRIARIFMGKGNAAVLAMKRVVAVQIDRALHFIAIEPRHASPAIGAPANAGHRLARQQGDNSERKETPNIGVSKSGLFRDI